MNVICTVFPVYSSNSRPCFNSAHSAGAQAYVKATTSPGLPNGPDGDKRLDPMRDSYCVVPPFHFALHPFQIVQLFVTLFASATAAFAIRLQLSTAVLDEQMLMEYQQVPRGRPGDLASWWSVRQTAIAFPAPNAIMQTSVHPGSNDYGKSHLIRSSVLSVMTRVRDGSE